MKKWIICGMTLIVCASAFAAREWFVDGTLATDTGDGKSEATAFRRIKTAIAAAGNGDTITVLPGVYGDNESLKDDKTTDIVNAYDQNNRVYINRQVTLRSRDGAAKTHIVGKWSTESAHGMGEGGLRCFCTTVACTVKGFTIRDGSTRYASDGSDCNANRGGGIYAATGNTTVFTDCVISNCVGTRGGAAYMGTYVRCHFDSNYGTAYGAAMRDAGAFNCLFTHNRPAIGLSADPGAVAYPKNIVNCTIINNATKGVKQVDAGVGRIVNTIVLNNTAIGEGIAVGSATWQYCVTDNGNVAASGTSCQQTTTGEFFSPASGDYRLVVGAKSAGAGSLNLAGLYYAAYTNETDFAGHPFVTDGKISAGCIQETVNAADCACLMVGGNTLYGIVSLNGTAIYGTQEYRSGKYPEIVKLTFAPIAGYGLLGFFNTTGAPDWPLENDAVYTLMPQTGTKTLNVKVGKVKWVDANHKDDSTADGSAEHPYVTLNQATTAQNDDWLIMVKDGTYDKGEYYSNGLTNRLWVNQVNVTRMRSENGAGKTFIVGAADPTGENGAGPAAIRGCCLGGSTQLQGFTITEGHTNNGIDDYLTRGGGVYCLGEGSQNLVAVTDCVISNCVGNRGAAMFGGTLERCRVTANTSFGNGVLRACKAYTSVIAKNEDPLNKGIIGYGTSLYQCSVIDNRTGNAVFTPAGGETVAATVVAGTRDKKDVTGQYNYFYNCVFATSGATSVERCVVGDPQLNDMANGDYRVWASSPAAHFAPLSLLYRATDFTGHPYYLDADGMFTAGAFTQKLPAIRSSSTVIADAVEPCENRALTAADALTYAASGDRNLLGFEVDGVFTPDTEGTRAITLTPVLNDANGDAHFTTVTAIYDTNWYVDAVNGDNAANGYSWATAKRTLAKAMKKMAEGDTLNAAPGIYDEGDMLQTSQSSMLGAYTPVVRARVVVESKRKLISRDGPETTFIVGAADTTSSGDADGLGDKAIRGVFLYDQSLLSGFTVTGGHTGAGAETMNACGGGIGGMGVSATVENCIVSNNVATRGASARYVTLKRCRILANKATGNAPSGRNITAYHCLFSQNVGNPTVNDMTLYNCTVAADNVTAKGGVPDLCWTGGKCVNTILGVGQIANVVLSNCAYRTGTRLADVAINEAPAIGDLALGARGVPGKTSVAVDAGDATLIVATDDAEHDLGGGQRIYNGALDIGCYEYDWRGDYAQAMGGSRATVTAAAPSVMLNGARVFLKDGTLSATWNVGENAGACRLPFTITGNGTLAISIDGGEAKTYTSSGTCEWGKLAGTKNLAFTYTPGADDIGGVTLGRLSRGLGFLISIQ